MLLGMWTTAATFYGLAFVDFPSLEQLGRLIGHSMVICGVLTLVLVPALLRRRRGRRPARSLRMPRLARWVERRRAVLLAGAAALTLVLGGAATRLQVNPTLERLRSVTPAAVLQETIAPRFGLPGEVYVLLQSGADLDRLLSLDEQTAAACRRGLPSMPLQPASSLLPSSGTQDARAAVVHRAGLRVDVVAGGLARTSEAEGFRPGSFDPFLQRLPRLLAAGERITYEGYHAHGLGDLIDRFVARTPSGWVMASYAFPSDAAQAAALERVVASVNPSATLTGLPLVNRELADRFLPQFLRGLIIGTVVVILIVALAFRDWWLSLLALLPTAIGLVWSAGVLALIGAELDLFALFAVVTLVGIGVDYGIHLIERYREHGDAAEAIADLAPVILVAAAITILGYGTLVTSSYPPLRSIGLVSAVSVTALAAASVLVLPALLGRRK
jgi:predicted RND superfamily exporter protein